MKNMTHDELVGYIALKYELPRNRAAEAKTFSKEDRRLMQKFVDEVNELGYDIEDFQLLNILRITDERMLPIVKKYLYKFSSPRISTRTLGFLQIKGFKEAAKLNIEF